MLSVKKTTLLLALLLSMTAMSTSAQAQSTIHLECKTPLKGIMVVNADPLTKLVQFNDVIFGEGLGEKSIEKFVRFSDIAIVFGWHAEGGTGTYAIDRTTGILAFSGNARNTSILDGKEASNFSIPCKVVKKKRKF